jgi:hypothetical protein
MPTSHRRLGLVVDEPMKEVLGALREEAQDAAESTLARRAVFGGAALTEVIRASADDPAAASAVQAMREALRNVRTLSDAVKMPVMEELDAAQAAAGPVERRERQRRMLWTPDPVGDQALALKGQLDTHDPLAG